jgi:hypothetical protein
MATFHGIEEVDLERISDVLRRHPKGSALAAAAAKQICNDVGVEIRPAIALSRRERTTTAVPRAGLGLGILAVKVSLRLPLGSGLVDLAGIVALTLVRIANDVVGRIDFLEALLCLGLGGVEIGMRLLGSLAVGLANVVLTCVGRHAQRLIGSGHVVSRLGSVLHIWRCCFQLTPSRLGPAMLAIPAQCNIEVAPLVRTVSPLR